LWLALCSLLCSPRDRFDRQLSAMGRFRSSSKISFFFGFRVEGTLNFISVALTEVHYHSVTFYQFVFWPNSCLAFVFATTVIGFNFNKPSV